MIDPTRHHDDARARHIGEVGEAVAEAIDEGGERLQAVSETHARREIAMRTGDNHAVEEGVPDARRRIGVIRDDVPHPVDVAHHIDRVTGQPALRRAVADCRHPVPRATPERLGLDDTFGDQLASAIEIADDRLEHLHTGNHACSQHLEFVAVQHVRNWVEPPGSRRKRHQAAVGTRRQVVHDVAGALEREDPVRIKLTACKIRQRGKR